MRATARALEAKRGRQAITQGVPHCADVRLVMREAGRVQEPMLWTPVPQQSNPLAWV